jgi:hypothetical protein
MINKFQDMAKEQQEKSAHKPFWLTQYDTLTVV